MLPAPPKSFYPVCEPLLAGNELKYVTQAVSEGWISSAGSFVEEFQKKFAAYCGVPHGIAVTNGTVAIHLALQALGIGKGDEVIIPSFTMIASAFAVCYVGATPVVVDCDESTWNIAPELIEAAVSERTRAIMAVHIMGLPCDMEPIEKIAAKHKISVIEDAAEAHGALYKGKSVGSFGKAATFSFFANKNLTTGEGGMVTTADADIASKCLYYKNLCFPLESAREYIHRDIGFNYRMSNLHAAIGVAQLEKADEYRNLRRNNASLYRSFLEKIPGIEFQATPQDALHVHWMVAIVVQPESLGVDRNTLMISLKKRGIDSRKLFVGMHQQPSLIKYGMRTSGEYRNTEKLSANGLYLPSASSLSAEDIEWICGQIADIHQRKE